jgi:hypothetical protein
VIKIITGTGKVFSNKLLTYNALDNSFYEVEIFPYEKVKLREYDNRMERSHELERT